MNRRWSHDVNFKNDKKKAKPSNYARDFQQQKSDQDISAKKSNEDWMTEVGKNVDEDYGIEISEQDKINILIEEEKVLDSMAKEFKKLVKEKGVKKLKLQVLIDRLNGMTFPEIAKKYETQ